MRTITHDLRKTLEGKETLIYELLCQNLSNKEICLQIDMPLGTLLWHLKNIYRKLGVEPQNAQDKHQARRRAILYGGTRIEQTVSYNEAADKSFTIKQIRTAAKKTGLSLIQIDDLISFLEMEI